MYGAACDQIETYQLTTEVFRGSSVPYANNLMGSCLLMQSWSFSGNQSK